METYNIEIVSDETFNSPVLAIDSIEDKRITVLKKFNLIFIEGISHSFSYEYGSCRYCYLLSDEKSVMYGQCICHKVVINAGPISIIASRGDDLYMYRGLNHYLKPNQSLYMTVYSNEIRRRSKSDVKLIAQYGYRSFIYNEY